MKNKILTIQGPSITTCIQAKTLLQCYMTWVISEVYWDTSDKCFAYKRCTIWNTTKYSKWFIVLLLLFFKDTKIVIIIHNTADNENVPPPQSVQRTLVPQFVLKTVCSKYRFDKCRGFSCSARGFSALHIPPFWLLMHPLKWDHASSIKKQIVQYILGATQKF